MHGEPQEHLSKKIGLFVEQLTNHNPPPSPGRIGPSGKRACISPGNEKRGSGLDWSFGNMANPVNAPAAPGTFMNRSKKISSCTAYIFMGETISTVGIDGEFPLRIQYTGGK